MVLAKWVCLRRTGRSGPMHQVFEASRLSAPPVTAILKGKEAPLVLRRSALPRTRAPQYSDRMNPIVRRLVVMGLCGTLCGCSGLIVRDDDSATLVAGKVVARLLVAIPTVGISEGILVDLKDAERDRAWRRQRLPQTAEACRKEWRGYVEDRRLRHIPDHMVGVLFAATGGDYVGGAVRALDLAGLVPDTDSLEAEWQHTLAREPQAALLAECSRRFHLDRLSLVR